MLEDGSRAAKLACMTVAACMLLLVATDGAWARPSEEAFAIEKLKIVPSTFQAGAHENLTTSFDFAHDGRERPFNDVRKIVTELPAGFVGSNNAVPTCTDSQLLATIPCFPSAVVGTITFDYGGERMTQPIFNMQPTTTGIAADLGFQVAAGSVVQHLFVKVRPNDEGLTVIAPEVLPGELRDISVTIWGVPASHEHDLARRQICIEFPLGSGEKSCAFSGSVAVELPPEPYLATPTSCTSPFMAKVRADTWETPGEWVEAATTIEAMRECERVPFNPSIEAQPTTSATESPSGLNLTVDVPQTWDAPNLIATSDLKDATVALPQGMTINPSNGSGLGVCTPQQYEAETASSLPGQGCPQESKIGTVDIETPLLSEKAVGSVYVAKPYDNEFGSLLSFYVVARIADRGVIVKVAGDVHLDESTGQIVTTFDNNPQVPFSRFTVKFHPGATAPLVSPPVCGDYAVQAALTPWSAPSEPHSISSPPFEIVKGAREGPCPAGGVPPFKPTVVSGTQDNTAGGYSPFYLRIAREDGEGEITKFTTVLPPGVSANLTGVPFCPDQAIEAARTAGGQAELEHPSCPAASEIGHTLVGAGVSSVLAWTPGKVYLAGPYHGSALSIVSITSATVGPFDLGTVVIRFALRINPLTAQAEIDSTGSDPIPHIIRGIVTHVREIHVYIDRPKFMLNPTGCHTMPILDTITGTGANIANPTEQIPATVAAPFTAADCANLAFKPIFKVYTDARTSRANGASLTVKLAYPRAPQGTQANIRAVKVQLPRQLPSRLTTLQKACPDTTFDNDPGACSSSSRVGTATATTPIVPVPLMGPAYFVSHGGAKFPELVIVLQGYGITVDLHGETFISKKGITSSTFRTVPDVPVGTFELKLPQGPYSALAANGNLCSQTLRMPTTLTAQNGITVRLAATIHTVHCPEQQRKHKRKR